MPKLQEEITKKLFIMGDHCMTGCYGELIMHTYFDEDYWWVFEPTAERQFTSDQLRKIADFMDKQELPKIK